LLAARWSPAAFDAGHTSRAADVDLLLEAARWAPSAGNSQPWAFVAGLRGDAVNLRLRSHVARSAADLSATASLLVANLCHRHVVATDWEYSEFAHYDLGQAVAHMCLQAQAIGLLSRQFRAFDRDGIAAEFAVPAHWEVTSMTAFGRVARGAVPHVPAARWPRPRRTRDELDWLRDRPE
jgi:nitroreductase